MAAEILNIRVTEQLLEIHLVEEREELLLLTALITDHGRHDLGLGRAGRSENRTGDAFFEDRGDCFFLVLICFVQGDGLHHAIVILRSLLELAV